MGRFTKFLIAGVAALATAAPGAARPHGMFDLYEANRAAGKPNLITEDFILLGYSMTIDRAIGETEEKVLLPESLKLVDDLAKALKAAPAEGAANEQAARGALDFLAVVRALLAGENPTEPAAVADEVRRVRAGGGIARSDLMLQSLDYSQFRPRGRYTRTEALQHYFVGTRYAGTVLFPIVATKATMVTAEEADRLTLEALLLARTYKQVPGLAARYNRMSQRLHLLFGPAEDLTLADMWSVPATLTAADARARLLDRARRNGHQPAILGAPVDLGHLEQGITAADALTGWRLFPSRYTPDSAAMQGLIFDHVKKYRGNAHPDSLVVIGGQPVKGFPLAREIMALLGSGEALRSLDKTDERNYEGYTEAFHKAALTLRGGSDITSRQLQIVNEWLRTEEKRESGDRLGTALGFWTWTRYNNFLYTKQSYTPVMKGIPLVKARNVAWIEPSARLYLRLANQLDAMKTVMPESNVGEMAQLLRRCAELSKLEKAGTGLSTEQVEFLNGLDLTFLKLTGRPDRPIIVDVHTDSNSGKVLEEAVAFPSETTRKMAGGQIATGARFVHKEFKQSLDHRLNDEEWLTILEKEDMPKAQSAWPVRSPRAARLILAGYQAGGGEDYGSLIKRGMALMEQNQWEDARQLFLKACSLANDKRQAAVAHARVGEALGKLGREREGIEYLKRSLEFYHYDQVEEELKAMRLSMFSKTQTPAEISAALKDQLASKRGTRVMPAQPLELRILFDFNEATLKPEGRQQVENLGEALAAVAGRGETVQIIGHTDLIGKPEYNQVLSERRAAAVADAIARRHNFPRDKMQTSGRGMREPLYQGTGPKESELNRRVEIMMSPGNQQ
jgi:outer membrane protein OmpA-like peptidoglycan-associated protein